MFGLVLNFGSLITATVVGVLSGAILHEMSHYLIAHSIGLSSIILLPLNPINRPWTWFSGRTTPKRYAAVAAGPLIPFILIALPIIVLLWWNLDAWSVSHWFMLGLAGSQVVSPIDIKAVYKVIRDPTQMEYYDESSGELLFGADLPEGKYVKIDPLRSWDRN